MEGGREGGVREVEEGAREGAREGRVREVEEGGSG